MANVCIKHAKCDVVGSTDEEWIYFNFSGNLRRGVGCAVSHHLKKHRPKRVGVSRAVFDKAIRVLFTQPLSVFKQNVLQTFHEDPNNKSCQLVEIFYLMSSLRRAGNFQQCVLPDPIRYDFRNK